MIVNIALFQVIFWKRLQIEKKKIMSQFSDICQILLKSGKICYKYGDGRAWM